MPDMEKEIQVADQLLHVVELQVNSVCSLLDETVTSVTSAVTEIDKKIQGSNPNSEHASSYSQIDGSKEKLSRIGKLFSSQHESVTKVQDVVTEAVFTLMGTLSADDLIRQRLEHTELAMNFLANNLNEMLDEQVTNAEKVEKIRKTVFASFTTEQEKKEFRSVFGKAG